MSVKARLVAIFRLTRREYLADFWITPPLTLALAVVSLRAGFGAGWLALFAFGLLAWTLYEYALHRWILHRAPFWTDVHAMHHDEPRDYVAVPPWVTLALYAATWLTLGFRASAIAVGFSVGYVAYAALHTLFHFRATRAGEPLYRLHRRHALHHLLPGANYGVTVDWWDRLLGTEAKRAGAGSPD